MRRVRNRNFMVKGLQKLSLPTLMTLMYEVGAGVDIKGKEAWKVDKILCECVHTVHTLEMDIHPDKS